MKLSEKRVLFTALIIDLLNFALWHGYEIAFDKEHNNHMKESLHYVGLAKDFVLYKDGKYLRDTEDYRLLGEYWKSLDDLCCWGGDFKLQDGCHFSITYNGKK